MSDDVLEKIFPKDGKSSFPEDGYISHFHAALLHVEGFLKDGSLTYLKSSFFKRKDQLSLDIFFSAIDERAVTSPISAACNLQTVVSFTKGSDELRLTLIQKFKNAIDNVGAIGSFKTQNTHFINQGVENVNSRVVAAGIAMLTVFQARASQDLIVLREVIPVVMQQLTHLVSDNLSLFVETVNVIGPTDRYMPMPS